MLSKRRLINSLFLFGLPVYGLGTYYAYDKNFSVGYVLAISPYLLILLIHLLDLAYTPGPVRWMFNRVYTVGLLYGLSLAASNWVGLTVGFPGLNPINVTTISLVVLLPFHAALVVRIRNRHDPGFDFSRLVLNSLLLLVAVNLLGYAAGLRTVVHGFEGRINLPFLRGIYDAAHLMSVINLMLLFYLGGFVKRPLQAILLSAFYLVNMAVMISVNSRLSFMIFLLLTVLFATRIMKGLRFVFPVSLFTMPLLVSFAHLVYAVLSLPVFATVVKRLDKDDVTTFNNRTVVWEEAWNWLLGDRRGFFFGNGTNGQYTLGLMDEAARVWQTSDAYNIHMHSTFLQIVMSQGVVGYGLFVACFWYAFKFFRERYRSGALEGPLFAAVVYLMFIWQIDIFCYGTEFGHLLFFSLLAYVALDTRYVATPAPVGAGVVPKEGV